MGLIFILQMAVLSDGFARPSLADREHPEAPLIEMYAGKWAMNEKQPRQLFALATPPH